MAMQLLRQTDPRDTLQRARKSELLAFAKHHHIGDVNEDMPAEIIRQVLRQKNFTKIGVPNRILGTPELAQREARVTPSRPSDDQNANVPQVSAVDDLMRQYKASKSLDDMTITDLRKLCKERGIAMQRRDNMKTLKAKLSGKDAPQRHQ